MKSQKRQNARLWELGEGQGFKELTPFLRSRSSMEWTLTVKFCTSAELSKFSFLNFHSIICFTKKSVSSNLLKRNPNIKQIFKKITKLTLLYLIFWILFWTAFTLNIFWKKFWFCCLEYNKIDKINPILNSPKIGSKIFCHNFFFIISDLGHKWTFMPSLLNIWPEIKYKVS